MRGSGIVKWHFRYGHAVSTSYGPVSGPGHGPDRRSLVCVRPEEETCGRGGGQETRPQQVAGMVKSEIRESGVVLLEARITLKHFFKEAKSW
jgi:hypothetical protein